MNKYIVCAVQLLILLTLSFDLAATQQNSRNVFEIKEAPFAKTDKASIAAVRESYIEFNFERFGRDFEADSINIPLFDDKVYQVQHTQTEQRSIDDFTWRGQIKQDKFTGDVILTIRRGYVAGLIYSPDAVYEIKPKGERQILIELDQRLFPECAGGIESKNAKNNSKPKELVTAVDSGDRIDVLVLYTKFVRNSFGGDEPTQAFVQQSVDTANTAYFNSKIRLRVKLAGAVRSPVDEIGSLSSELITISTNAAVAALRNQYKADLVALISTTNDNTCGAGLMMGNSQTSGDPDNAFSVTNVNCTVGNLSFVHELGHNMGSQHNPESGGAATYPYGFGHYMRGAFSTVMSYTSSCEAPCPKRLNFSNPEILINGFPSGIYDRRDNARSINNTADAVANYRYSGSNLMLNNFNGGEILPRHLTRTISWSSDNINGNVRIELSRDETTNWETLIDNTPNDGAENINIYGRPSRRARLRVVSIENTAISDTSSSNITIR